jgi:hypothetical protein
MSAPAVVLSRPAVGDVLRLHNLAESYRCRVEVLSVWPDGDLELRLVSQDADVEPEGLSWTLYATEVASGGVELEVVA